DSGDGIARADLAGIDAMIVEVLAVQHAGLVADQAIFGDASGIELDLDLYVVGDREHVRGHFVAQHAAGFAERIDVSGNAVAVLRQRLHQGVVVVAAAEAEHRKVDAGVALTLDEVLEFLRIVDANVEVAIGGDDDAVDAALAEVLLG